MKDRLIQLLDLEQLTPSKFADLIGVQRSSVSHVLSGRNNPSYDFIQKTMKAFPGLNAEWLIMGRGAMYAQMGRKETGTLFDIPAAEQAVRNANDHVEPVKEIEDERKGGSSTEAGTGMDVLEGKAVQQQPAGQEQRRDSGQEITGREPPKKVVKVVIFYEDDTFKSFEPSV
jgi:transcriptional regulator with XRE-family HTH domain